MQQQSIESIRETISVPVAVGEAFSAFVDEFDSWWPPEFTWSGEVLETVKIEPKEGGRCFERGPHAFEIDWGRVLVCERPDRLVFTWQISPDRQPQPDPAKASRVTIDFEPAGDGRTKIKLEHQNLANHGKDSKAYREALAAPQGWPYILDRYTAMIGDRSGKKNKDLVARAAVTIEASPSEVWEALVDPESIQEYMFGTHVVTDWEIGSPIAWQGEWQGKAYEDKGEILNIEQQRVLQYSHYSPLSGKADKPENYHTVTIRLSAEGENTQVILTQDRNESVEARQHSQENWETMLDGLKDLVEA